MAFHPTYDPSKRVDLEKLRSVSVSGSAMPTRSGVRQIAAREDRWSKDFAAYRRLRREGLQPQSADGAAELEARADTREQVEGVPA